MQPRFLMRYLALIAGAFFVCIGAQADSIAAGTFNISGTVFITTSQMEFGLSSIPPPGDQQAQIANGNSGAFASLTPGSTATIENFFYSPFVTLPNWIQLPDGIDVNLGSLPVNSSVPLCTGTAADDTVGNSCRPSAMSPFVLTQDPNAVALVFVTDGSAYSGPLAGGSTPITGIFTSQFAGNEGTITKLLANFAADQDIENTYSATFNTVAVATTPEPSTLVTSGSAALLAALLFLAQKKSWLRRNRF